MASSTFIALCQAQLALMAEALHLGRGVVYLAQDWAGTADAPWVPVLEYPAATGGSLQGQGDRTQPGRSLLLTGTGDGEPIALESLESDDRWGDRWGDRVARDLQNSRLKPRETAQRAFDPQAHPGRLVLPLAREGVVLGLLVLDRARPWTARDQQQAGRVAMTLAAACELDRRNQLLEAAYRQQQATQERQAELLHNWLHQFRNPLTAIRTFGKLVLKRLGGEDRSRPHVEGLLRESDRLQTMLTEFNRAIDTTDWTGDEPLPTDHGRSELPPAPISAPSPPLLLQGVTIEPWTATALLSDAIVAAEALALERGLQFAAQRPDRLPRVLANGTAWREVFSNLLDNAIKYAGDRARVDVTARVGTWRDRPAAGVGLAIAVTNEGSNIPPQDLSRLFDRGFRGTQAAGPIPGTGLGLAIARQLMEQMQGRLELFSPPIDLGEVLELAQPIDPLPSPNPITAGAMAVAWLPLAEP